MSLRHHPPLEDDLGDVLEKAARHAKLGFDEIARRANVPPQRLQDALDYRSELSQAELGRLAVALHLNEVGLCALAQGAYPSADLAGLPFRLHPLSMPHGVGVANAFLVSTGGSSAVLFDSGASHAELHRAWPKEIESLDAVFVTHYEAEHIGGLEVVLRESGLPHFHGPPSGRWPQCRGLDEGQGVDVAGLRVTALRTPGHAAEHNCYTVALASAATPNLLVSGDLIFAGSLGGGYFCCQRQLQHARRVLALMPGEAVIAPGHGPLTTVACERRYNPFLS
jgi:glyoxylase-like metal-dependent hydrolase (beta-lactamase superfamily II)